MLVSRFLRYDSQCISHLPTIKMSGRILVFCLEFARRREPQSTANVANQSTSTILRVINKVRGWRFEEGGKETLHGRHFLAQIVLGSQCFTWSKNASGICLFSSSSPSYFGSSQKLALSRHDLFDKKQWKTVKRLQRALS